VPNEVLKKKLVNNYVANMDYSYINQKMSRIKMDPVEEELQEAITLMKKEFS